jgi:hypothetical protein
MDRLNLAQARPCVAAGHLSNTACAIMAQIGGQNANIVHSVAVLKLRIIDDE